MRSAQARSRLRPQMTTVMLLFGGYAACYFCRADLSVATPLLIQELGTHGVSHTEAIVRIGTMSSFGVLAYALGKLFLGWLGDFWGGRPNFLIALAGATAFTLLFATGATLPGYPVQLHDSNTNLLLLKSAAAAADEPVLETCGDEILNVQGETCEPPGSPVGNTGQTCRQNCTYCGDGVPDTGEQCDDGNDVNTDDCRNDCTLPRCGDGILDPNEICDDGNTTNGDGCSSNCMSKETCGNGIVDVGEACDDGKSAGDPNATKNADGCSGTPVTVGGEMSPGPCKSTEGDGFIDCSDPDCDCLPIGRDPGAIRFGPPTAHDLLAVHGSLKPETPIDGGTEKVTFLLTKENGTVKIFALTIPAGDLKKIGRNLFRYKNNLAQRNRSGLARFDLRYFPRRDNYTFVLKAFGDLSAATVADMAAQLFIGDDGFLNKSTWGKTPIVSPRFAGSGPMSPSIENTPSVISSLWPG